MDEDLSDYLDELVHDIKSGEAAVINNAGLQAQLEYLGLTRDQAEAAMSASSTTVGGQ